jgi:hypothetical protein
MVHPPAVYKNTMSSCYCGVRGVMGLCCLRPGLCYLAYAGTGGPHEGDYPSENLALICDHKIFCNMYQQQMLTGVYRL